MSDEALAVEQIPAGEDFLLLSPTVQPFAYRMVDRMFAMWAVRAVRAGGGEGVLADGWIGGREGWRFAPPGWRS